MAGSLVISPNNIHDVLRGFEGEPIVTRYHAGDGICKLQLHGSIDTFQSTDEPRRPRTDCMISEECEIVSWQDLVKEYELMIFKGPLSGGKNVPFEGNL